MNHHFYLHYVLPVVMLSLAGFYFTIAIRAWRFRRPFLMSQRWMLGLMVVAFAPSFLNPFLFPHHSFKEPASLVAIQWINPLMFIVLLIFFWFTLQGYIAYAVTEKSFRDAFLAATDKLGYTCEERLSTMRILPVDVTIQVAVQGWIGCGSLRDKSRSNAPLLKSIVAGMNTHWAEQGGETNQIATSFYAIIGLFMIAMAVVLGLLKF